MPVKHSRARYQGRLRDFTASLALYRNIRTRIENIDNRSDTTMLHDIWPERRMLCTCGKVEAATIL